MFTTFTPERINLEAYKRIKNKPETVDQIQNKPETVDQIQRGPKRNTDVTKEAKIKKDIQKETKTVRSDSPSANAINICKSIFRKKLVYFI